MKVLSVNRGEARTVTWSGKKVKTGIFKYPVEGAIYLGAEDVVDDAVVDRKHHGGVDMAVYAYSANHYSYWKAQFPKSDWSLGMFGENLTIDGLDEASIHIGSIYQVGEAEIQVCQPRQPCYKLGIRFGTQAVLKKYINLSYSGVYFRVMKPGFVNVGDELKLISTEPKSPTIAAVFSLMYHKNEADLESIEKAIHCQVLPQGVREMIKETQLGK
ncbi:MAG: MOSC domain-containing protein [Flavobacteriales bacterium]|jgi:MOSC domain-containing protein YiiM|nr:MOSC domain-containing protein [Flavobacteriales bacterium]